MRRRRRTSKGYWTTEIEMVLCMAMCAAGRAAGVADEPPPRTTLSNPAIRYRVPEKPYVVLRRGDVEAVIVDNRAVDDAVLPGHLAGYSGVGSLKHARRRENLFVPENAGLNFEHVHDGTTLSRPILFEPRNAPMELRAVDPHTAELYQKPSPHFGLESCHRYHLLEDGTIEMTVECIPRRPSFKYGYVGLFWASYINRPESLDIHFRGYPADKPGPAEWVRGVTPAHGVRPTHLAAGDRREFPHDPDFPLSLVFNLSQWRYSEPRYYGVSHGMALVFIFRPGDQVRFSQSPSGGSGPAVNPAWDFQCLIPDYQVGRRYQIVTRAMYLPYESPEQIERASRPDRDAMAR